MSISGRSQQSNPPVSPALRPSRAPSRATSRGQTPSSPNAARSPTRKVTMVPPWAHDEPPSPAETPYVSPIIDSLRPTDTIPPLSLSPVTSGQDPEERDRTLSSAGTSQQQGPETSWWTFVTHPLPRGRQHADKSRSRSGDRGNLAAEADDDPTSPRSPAAPFEPHLHISPPSSPTSPDSNARRAARTLGSFFPRASMQRHLTMPSVPFPSTSAGPGPSDTPASPSSVLRSLQFPRAAHTQRRVEPPRPPSPALSEHRPASMHLDLSHPEQELLPSNTLRQVMTPGWESPWRPTLPLHVGQEHSAREGEDYGWDLSGHPPHSASTAGEGLSRGRSRARTALTDASGEKPPGPERGAESTESRWRKGRRRWRNFCLYHSSTPLLFRLLNLIFTTSALAVAIHIQLEEGEAGVEGVLGSSTAVTVVFAPLTLIHVLAATYLEYFGRPLGLWRTSAKLAYTLVEVIFVCLWSSALSLAVDNYLTTPLRCAPRHLTSWWSDQPPTPNPLSADDADVGTTVCHLQAALISLVLVGLCSYCANLVISLFRIFERVKVRTVDYRWGAWGNAGAGGGV